VSCSFQRSSLHFQPTSQHRVQIFLSERVPFSVSFPFLPFSQGVLNIASDDRVFFFLFPSRITFSDPGISLLSFTYQQEPFSRHEFRQALPTLTLFFLHPQFPVQMCLNPLLPAPRGFPPPLFSTPFAFPNCLFLPLPPRQTPVEIVPSLFVYFFFLE